MTREEIDSKISIAHENHKKGYNCAQSVSCAFSDRKDFDEETIFCLTEGLGLGMGGMQGLCGAIAAAGVLAGAKCSTGNLKAPDSKASSYRLARACLERFKEKDGAVLCRDLKGLDTGTVLRPCPECISDAVEIIAELLYSE